MCLNFPFFRKGEEKNNRKIYMQLNIREICQYFSFSFTGEIKEEKENDIWSSTQENKLNKQNPLTIGLIWLALNYYVQF